MSHRQQMSTALELIPFRGAASRPGRRFEFDTIFRQRKLEGVALANDVTL